MKVLFLDVDGVLNKTSDCEVIGDPQPYHRLNLRMLENLQDIVKSTECKVVVTSTWRKDGGIKYLQDILKSLLSIDVYGETPRHSNGHRGNEIKEWIEDNGNVEVYAIVDDDSDMRDEQLAHFFQTDPDHGLTDVITYRIKYHLGWRKP